MKPFKRILVPVDFSPHSSEAIEAAADLARRYDGVLTLLNVWEGGVYYFPEGYVLYSPEQLRKVMTELGKHLEVSRREAEAAGAVHVETKQREGVAASEIVDFAREGDFDLIVMGTHGRTGVKHALMGSVAERVVRKAPCPVLTLRAKTT
jgi:nucleotide-binding universal stress UspA family protein